MSNTEAKRKRGRLSQTRRSSQSSSDSTGPTRRTFGHEDHRMIGDELAADLDRSTMAAMAQMTFGLAVPHLVLAYTDWGMHLLRSPGKLAQLSEDYVQMWRAFLQYTKRSLLERDAAPAIEPEPGDRRFNDAAWQKWPFNWYSQGFLLGQEWCDRAMHGVQGISARHENLVRFYTRMTMDAFAPSNFPWTNPVILDATRRTGGENLMRGAMHLLEDTANGLSGDKAATSTDFKVGRDVAVTPGKIVYRNKLMELIQYTPATEKAYAEPVLITPAWIMKYYILDLSPHNSLVRHLVEQGHTVFMISWKNPTEEDRDVGMDDYRKLGIMAALDAVRAIVPDRKIHAMGYCVGGTLLSIAAATMARAGDDRLKSVTLLAAQTDFTEAGELLLFINDAQLTYLDSVMWKRGYLAADQMAGAFSLLRANDLVWARIIKEYFLGERQRPNDLMSWNADATRMPYSMHSEYLRRLYLENALAEGRYEVEGHRISISDINAPLFVVSTVKDHVAPWPSVYKIRQLVGSEEVTFVLTNRGHNGGIVSEPGHKGRNYRIDGWREEDEYVGPEEWQASASEQEGSWWPAWQKWLARHSGNRVNPPSMGAPKAGLKVLEDAPGTYVHQH